MIFFCTGFVREHHRAAAVRPLLLGVHDGAVQLHGTSERPAVARPRLIQKSNVPQDL